MQDLRCVYTRKYLCTFDTLGVEGVLYTKTGIFFSLLKRIWLAFVAWRIIWNWLDNSPRFNFMEIGYFRSLPDFWNVKTLMERKDLKQFLYD